MSDPRLPIQIDIFLNDQDPEPLVDVNLNDDANAPEPSTPTASEEDLPPLSVDGDSVDEASNESEPQQEEDDASQSSEPSDPPPPIIPEVVDDPLRATFETKEPSSPVITAIKSEITPKPNLDFKQEDDTFKFDFVEIKPEVFESLEALQAKLEQQASPEEEEIEDFDVSAALSVKPEKQPLKDTRKTGLLAKAGLTHNLAAMLRIVGAKNAAHKATDYTVYIVEYNTASGPKTVPRRFSEIAEFQQALGRTFVCPPSIPGKTVLRRFDREFVERRIVDLQVYLHRLYCRYDIRHSEHLERFLEYDEPDEPPRRPAELLVNVQQKIDIYKFVINDLVYIEDGNSILVVVGDKDMLSKLDSWFSSTITTNDVDFVPLGALYGFYGFADKHSTQQCNFVQTLYTQFRREALCVAWDQERRWAYVGQDKGLLEIYNISPDMTYTVKISECQAFKDDPIVCLSFTRTKGDINSCLVMCSRSGIVSIFDADSQTVVASDTVSPESWIVSAFYDGTHGRAFIGNVGREIIFIHTDAHPPCVVDSVMEQDGSIRCLVYHEKSNLLLSGSYDQTIAVWHVPPKGEEDNIAIVGTLTGHSASVECMAFAPSGRYVASGDAHGNILLWDLHSSVFNCIMAFRPHSKSVTGIHLKDDGTVISSSSDRTIQIWKTDLRPPKSSNLNLVVIQ